MPESSPAYREGFRHGKLGWPASQSPHDARDMSPEARDWRRGWTAGNALHRKAIARAERES